MSVEPNPIVQPAKRAQCVECDGRGGRSQFYDYARGIQQREFCIHCDGRGYVDVPEIRQSFFDALAQPITSAGGN